MNKKILIPIIVILIIAAGIGAYSVFQKPVPVQRGSDSPFGIFNPYEVFLDRPEFITQAGINNYIKELGVPWVQGMPFDLDSLAQGGAQLYSRVIPLGKPINFPREIEFWTEIIKKNKGRVKYWEIDTEPESCPLPKEQGTEGCWKKPEDYVEYQKTFYGIIKKECPDCTVVFGGIGGPDVGFTENSPQAKWLKSALDASGGKYFDAFEFKQHYHKANEYTELKNKIEVYGKILSGYGIDIKKMPVFIETAMYDGQPETLVQPPLPFQSETQQAAGLIKTYIFGIAQGIDKIFWNYVVERNEKGPDQINTKEIFNYYGLVNNPDNDGLSHKKLSYYTYKKMIEILEGSDWNSIQTIQESDGVYIYKFTLRHSSGQAKQGKPIWVAWNDNSGEKQVTISGINSSQVKITETVPKYESGKDVTDYNTAFNKETKSAQNGKISTTLGNKPVFVEQQ